MFDDPFVITKFEYFFTVFVYYFTVLSRDLIFMLDVQTFAFCTEFNLFTPFVLFPFMIMDLPYISLTIVISLICLLTIFLKLS